MRKLSHIQLLVVLAGLVFSGCSSDATSSKSAVTRSALTTNGADVTLTVSSSWGAGYCANVVVKNGSSSQVTNWSVIVEMNQSTVSQIWSATSTTSGSKLTVTPAAYAQSIAPGATTTFGFCGTATGTNYLPVLSSIAITGGQSGAGTGGANGAGGAATTGGTQPTGGSPSTGGAKPTGGASPTGGAKATGGTPSTGGAATGGAKAAGGSSSVAMCTADTSGKTKFCNPNSVTISGLTGNLMLGGITFSATGSSISIKSDNPVSSGVKFPGLSPFNTGDCNGAGVKAVSLATSQPYTGLGLTITNSGTTALTVSLYVDDLTTSGQFVQRKYTFPQIPADNTAHSYNLTWGSAFTESCTLPAGSSFDQTKILGLGFGIEASSSPVQLSLLVSDIKFTGGGTSSPCSAYCSSPKDFTVTGSFSSGNLGNSAFCYQTTSNFNGGGCGNFVSPRTLNINGTQINCNAWSLPAKVNGGYCLYGNPGDYAWAYFGVW